MIKGLRKTVALLACFSVVATSAIGCSKQSAAPASTQASATSSAAAEASPTPKKELKLTLMRDERPNQTLRADAPILDEIYKKTGVRLEIESAPYSDYKQKARILLATGDIPDIMITKYSEIKDFAAGGAFLAVSDYLDLMPNFKKALDADKEVKKYYFDGKLYGFPILSRHTNKLAVIPFIRQDLLTKYNLKTPDSFDELLETLKKFKEADPNSYPWTTRSGKLLSIIAYPMGSGYGMYYDVDIDGGKWVYGTVRPEFKEVLAYANKLYKSGVLDPDFEINTDQQWQEKLSSNKATFYYDNGSYALNFNGSLKSIDPSYNFQPLPLLKNSKGERRNIYYESAWYSQQYIVNSKIKDPEAVMKFFDWMYSDEGADITNFGILGQDYTVENGEYKVSKDLVDKFSKNSDPWRSYMGELGAGLFGYCTYVDERSQYAFMSDEVKGWYDQWGNDPNMDNAAADPPFTKEEAEKLKDLETKVDTLLTQELNKFVMGEKSLDDFEALQQKAKQAGADEIEKIYNEAEARLK